MPSIFRALLWLCLLCNGALVGTWTQAAEPQAATANAITEVSDFDETTWAGLLQGGPRPAAYLFTTSYCSTCPQAFAQLKRAVDQQHARVPLVAVMMDVGGAQAMRHALHFQGLTRMYAFDGFEPAIRQSVDPAWPNVTPYVVMIDKKGRVQRSIGPPIAKALRAWLG
jgi:hypothetical protein